MTEAVIHSKAKEDFWKALEDEVLSKGGSKDMIEEVVGKKSMQKAVKRLAEEVLHEAGAILSHQDLIKWGHYDFLRGYAVNPQEIKGQVFHSAVNSEFKLVHTEMRNKEKIFEHYGDRIADLTELLEYGIKHPWITIFIGIVWKDGDQYWDASIYNEKSHRGLDIQKNTSDDSWGYPDDSKGRECNLLLRQAPYYPNPV